MKKTLFLSLGIALLLSSCQQLQNMTQAPTSVQAPKFTTMEKLIQLTPGMSLDDVVKTLGTEPYDVYTINHETNQTVYIWHYKKVQRTENPVILATRSGATSGAEVLCCLEVVYVTLENQKFVRLITDAGKQNTRITKEKEGETEQQESTFRSIFRRK
ncbi:MAG: hypothetical protein LAT76_07730 [Schleiferiaceae bacterium]|nr:hypothetical protein [Schleiferiaceae bacterium]